VSDPREGGRDPVNELTPKSAFRNSIRDPIVEEIGPFKRLSCRPSDVNFVILQNSEGMGPVKEFHSSAI
jgi:hypothetical protein